MTQEVIAVREVTTKHEVGTTCIQIKDFWAYVTKKRTSRQDLLKLPPEKREDFFIRWKHGMTDMNVNWEFEYSLRAFLKNFNNVNLQDVDPYFRDAVRIRRDFDTYCDGIKEELNIWTGKKSNAAVPKKLQQMLDQVGGSIV